MQPKNSYIIAYNPSIDLVVSTIKKVGREGRNSEAVNRILRKHPYLAYTNKYIWLRDVFNTIHTSVEYEFDAVGREQIKTPNRFVVKDGAGDCDDYSTLWVAILSRLNIRHYVKIVKYSPIANWAHVYVVVPTPNRPNKHIICDNVIKAFDKEVKHTESKIY